MRKFSNDGQYSIFSNRYPNRPENDATDSPDCLICFWSYHDEHFLNPPIGLIFTIFKSYLLHCDNSISFGKLKVWAVSGMFSHRIWDHFLRFYDILKKIVILEVWQSCNIRVVKNVPHLPNLKIRPGLLFVENIFFDMSNDLQSFFYGLPGTQRC